MSEPQRIARDPLPDWYGARANSTPGAAGSGVRWHAVTETANSSVKTPRERLMVW
jgi:hypothetical protein